MPVRTRNLLLFAALVLAAVVTSILARGPRILEATGTPPRTAAQGYLLRDAVLDVTDEAGNLSYRIIADRVEQQPETEDFVFEQMEVRYEPSAGIRWRLSAAGAYMPRNRAFFVLEDVSLFYTPDSGGEDVTIETTEMRFDTRELLASTDEPVLFRQGSAEMSAVGMSVNLETDTFELRSDVKSQFLP